MTKNKYFEIGLWVGLGLTVASILTGVASTVLMKLGGK